MKIQCSVCEAAEASVLCCADEAALCWACDQKVHAANKLAGKHQRVPLATSSSQMPKCDICQEAVGYFFCLEDRALLCRKCDVSIHTANPFVSAHQRFLLTGVQVGLEPTEAGGSSSSGKSHANDKMSEQENQTQSIRTAPDMSSGQYDRVPSQVTGGSASGSVAQWQFDEFIGLNDFNQGYNFLGNGSSKADCGNLGDSDSSPNLRTAEEELHGDESLGQVPEMPSPPTASGLCWQKSYENPPDSAFFVPDIQDFSQDQSQGSAFKRRRQF